jgi:hypothetical protein
VETLKAFLLIKAVMKRIRYNPYTCHQCYFNVTTKQSPGTDLGQFRCRTTGQRKYTASLRLILMPHSYDQAAASTNRTATFVLHTFIALHILVLLFFWRTYTLRTDSLYVKFAQYNLNASHHRHVCNCWVPDNKKSVGMFMMCLQLNLTCVSPVVH